MNKTKKKRKREKGSSVNSIDSEFRTEIRVVLSQEHDEVFHTGVWFLVVMAMKGIKSGNIVNIKPSFIASTGESFYGNGLN